MMERYKNSLVWLIIYQIIMPLVLIYCMDIPDCLDQEVLFNNWLAFCSGVFHEAEL